LPSEPRCPRFTPACPQVSNHGLMRCVADGRRYARGHPPPTAQP
jgi:hypothetical protein